MSERNLEVSGESCQVLFFLQNICLLSNHTTFTNCLDNHIFICCGFVKDPPEVESARSDRLQSDEQSSPLDCRAFKKGDRDPKSPSPADTNPTIPPMTPSQPYYVQNGETPHHFGPSKPLRFVQERCNGYFCVPPRSPRAPHDGVPSLLQADVCLGSGALLL